MNPTRRTSRVASLIRDEMARLLVLEVSDPRLVGVSITDVEVSRDLSEAKVFYVLGVTSDAKEVARALGRAKPFFRRTVGEALQLRQVPDLVFELDTHTDQVNRLMGLLDEVSGGCQGNGESA